jgi:two-component system, sensor histidine kinase PdtaS
MQIKAEFIGLRKIKQVGWVLLFMLLCMIKTNAQTEITGYSKNAWQRSGRRIAARFKEFSTLIAGVDTRREMKHSSGAELADTGELKLLAGNDKSQHLDASKGNESNFLLIATAALSLLNIVLLLLLYRTNLNNNHLREARQRELAERNKSIEVLSQNQENLLKEKEWLLKEVQHRVKNNLQMVTSLLYSQSVYLEDGAALMAIKDSLRRIQAMSLIHQKLYGDNNTTTISMPEYIDDLVKYLDESFDTDTHIVFEQTIAPVQLGVSQVLPLGLIFTESIVNAIKYAFLKGQQGIVGLFLGHDGPGHLLVRIVDNGVGLPERVNIMEPHSLGLDLIKGLAKQLNGSFRIENNNGVHITIRFPVKRQPTVNMNG